MSLKEIQVTKTEDGIEVDFWPGMFVKPTYEKEPTKTNPKVAADLGVVGGKLSPLKAYYPDDIDIEQIIESADPIDRKDNLFKKTAHCPMCERKKREIIGRLRSVLKEEGTPEDRYKRLVEEGEKIKKELRGQRPPEEDISSQVSDPIPSVSQEVAQVSAPSSVISQELTEPSSSSVEEEAGLDQEFVNNMNKAMTELEKTVTMIINTPDQIILPFADDE